MSPTATTPALWQHRGATLFICASWWGTFWIILLWWHWGQKLMSAISQPYCVGRVRVVLHEQLWSQFVMCARNKWFSIRQDGIKEGVVYLNDVMKVWGLPILQKVPLACRFLFFLPIHCGFLFFFFFFFFFYYFLFATSENHLPTKLVEMSASCGLDQFCFFFVNFELSQL